MIREFNTNIKEPVRKISKWIEKKFPKRSWHIEAIIWDDMDYKLTFESNWGKRKDEIKYRKADNEYKYIKSIQAGEIKQLAVPCFKEIENKVLKL